MNCWNRRSLTITAGLVVTLVLWAGTTCSGCRHVPFYRMTNKASQSLPLSREGIAAFERGDLDEAEEKLSKAVELNDSDVETCRYYGETLWKRGKRVEAMDVLRDAADKHGPVDSQSSLYRSLGEKALDVDRADQTLIWANKIVDLAPKSSVGWTLRGKAERELGRPEEALADFQRAVHFEADNRELLREIAILQNEIGDYDSALATWQYLEQLYPTNREPAEVFAGKGSAYAGLGLLVEAQSSYEIAVKYAPEAPDFRLKLAETAVARKDYEAAATALASVSPEIRENPAFQKLYQTVRSEVLEVAENTTEGVRIR